jgi:hypothetical protein
LNPDKEVITSDDPLTKTIIKIHEYLYRHEGSRVANRCTKEIERIIREDYKIMDDQDKVRHGSPQFYHLLEVMADLHDKKSHDYANNKDPFGNYYFAGKMSKLFNNPADAGFFGRIAEKIFRLANLENSGKMAKNEGVEDTEIDICVITTLWMASRVQRREASAKLDESFKTNLREGNWETESSNKGYQEKSRSETNYAWIIKLLGDVTPVDRIGLRDYINALIRDDNWDVY